MDRRTPILLLVALALTANTAWAADPPRCSVNTGGTHAPPSGRVAITIHKMDTNGDMEPDFLFYDNRSDIFGKVTIDADGTPETFDLPEMSETDDPVWTYGNKFVSRPAIPGRPVRVVIHLEENDSGITWNNDVVDVSPDPNRNDLEFTFDTCSQLLTGDVNGSAGIIPVPSSGTAENQGVLTFEIRMDDDRALSTAGDVALQGLELIQVMPGASRLVAGKPTVGLVTVANNTKHPQPVSVRLRVHDETNTVLHDSTESLGSPLEVGEVRSIYLAKDNPIIPPDFHCKPSRLYAQADLILQPGAEDPGNAKDCWVINNSIHDRNWEVTNTRGPSLLWVRTGHVLNATSLASMSQLHAIRNGAMPFIRGVYPAPSFDDTVSSFPLVPPLSGGVFGFVASIFAALGIPVDAATPYVMVLELNAAAALAGHDRLMGALPKDWFGGTLYGIMDGVTGLSLGELAPRAVLFESVTSDGWVVGPKHTLPAHELGHTYGLSLDPTIKSFWCQFPSAFGIIACGIAGGFDEYQSNVHPAGVPTWGYWVPQDPDGPTGREGEQCDASCLMGSAPINAYDTWSSNRKLIDRMDYEHLLNRLDSCQQPAPASALFVSGVIASDDTMAFGTTFLNHGLSRPSDFADKPGEWQTLYGLRLVDGSGKTLSEMELPLNWSSGAEELPVPATFFGGFVPFQQGTAKIQIWNRESGNLVGEQIISANPPKLGTPSVKVSGPRSNRVLDIAWTADDVDKDTLIHFVQVSPDHGRTWWPIAHGLTSPTFSASLADVTSGTYTVRVISSDGVNVDSAETTLSL